MAYAAHRLTGEAKRWWQDKKVVLVADLGSKTAISWGTRVLSALLSPSRAKVKAREFLDLVQGEMSVIEYATKILQLSCFDVYLIPNEEKKAKKFKRDLNSRIQIMMSFLTFWISPSWYIWHLSTRRV